MLRSGQHMLLRLLLSHLCSEYPSLPPNKRNKRLVSVAEEGDETANIEDRSTTNPREPGKEVNGRHANKNNDDNK